MSPLDIVTRMSFEPIPTTFVVLTTLWYLLTVWRLTSKGRRWPVGRTVSWLVAELLLAVGLVSGIATDDRKFSVHAVQLTLILMIAPVFLALGAPLTLLLQASGKRIRSALGRRAAQLGLQGPRQPRHRVGRLRLGSRRLYLTSLYALSLRNTTVHGFVDIGLIVVGCLFWWPVIGLDPIPFRTGYAANMAYLFLAMPFYTIVGLSLQSQSHPIAPGTTVADLHNGAELIWTAGEVMGLIGVLVVFAQWLSADERRATVRRPGQRGRSRCAARPLESHPRGSRPGRLAALSHLVGLGDIRERGRLKGVVRRTPVERSEALSRPDRPADPHQSGAEAEDGLVQGPGRVQPHITAGCGYPGRRRLCGQSRPGGRGGGQFDRPRVGDLHASQRLSAEDRGHPWIRCDGPARG